MHTTEQRVAKLIKQGLQVRFAATVNGDAYAYHVSNKEGTTYSLRPEQLKELDEHGQLSWAGIRQLHEMIKALERAIKK